MHQNKRPSTHWINRFLIKAPVYKDAARNVQTQRFYCFLDAYKNLPIKSKANLVSNSATKQ